MVKEEILDMAEELRQILGSVEGVERVEEQFEVAYLLVVSDKEKKQNAEKVAETMKSQASNYGLSLDFTVTTEEELQEARDKLIDYMKENKTFGEG